MNTHKETKKKRKFAIFRVIGGLAHNCKFDKYSQKEYSVMYSNKWINYDIHWCKCGNYKLHKNCGTLEIEDVPEWAAASN